MHFWRPEIEQYNAIPVPFPECNSLLWPVTWDLLFVPSATATTNVYRGSDKIPPNKERNTDCRPLEKKPLTEFATVSPAVIYCVRYHRSQSRIQCLRNLKWKYKMSLPVRINKIMQRTLVQNSAISTRWRVYDSRECSIESTLVSYMLYLRINHNFTSPKSTISEC